MSWINYVWSILSCLFLDFCSTKIELTILIQFPNNKTNLLKHSRVNDKLQLNTYMYIQILAFK